MTVPTAGWLGISEEELRALLEGKAQEDLWREGQHRRDLVGRFTKGGTSVGRYVPRTPEAIAAKRVQAYEKRWGPIPADAPAAKPTVEQFDDPELLDALEDAQAKNVTLMGTDLFDFYGEQPIVLKENLGEGFWAAVAQADGLYSAAALRDTKHGPSLMEGKPFPKTGDRSQALVGGGCAHDLASVVRHEWFHHAENRLTQEQMYVYRRLFPRTEDGKLDEFAIGYGLGSNAAANHQECAAELYALVTDPQFRESEWPPWVGEAGYAVVEALYQAAGL
jgi:hypothetical protein